MKPIEIKYRKLGRERAHGQAWKEDYLIEIDNRLKGKDLLETIIHEVAHVQNPTWSEIKVQGHAKQMADILWDQGFRKVET